MTKALDDLLHIGLDHARRVLIDEQEEVVPMFLIVTGENFSFVSAGADGPAQSETLLMALQDRVHSGEVDAFCFLSEAWMEVQDHPPRPDEPPSLDVTDRIEAVCCRAESRRGWTVRAWRIVRSEDGACVRLDEMATSETRTEPLH